MKLKPWDIIVAVDADEMICKIKSYAHAAEYAYQAEPEILQKAINEKKYPFNEKTPFHIRELDIQRDKEFYPDGMEDYIGCFDYMVKEENE